MKETSILEWLYYFLSRSSHQSWQCGTNPSQYAVNCVVTSRLCLMLLSNFMRRGEVRCVCISLTDSLGVFKNQVLARTKTDASGKFTLSGGTNRLLPVTPLLYVPKNCKGKVSIFSNLSKTEPLGGFDEAEHCQNICHQGKSTSKSSRCRPYQSRDTEDPALFWFTHRRPSLHRCPINIPMTVFLFLDVPISAYTGQLSGIGSDSSAGTLSITWNLSHTRIYRSPNCSTVVPECSSFFYYWLLLLQPWENSPSPLKEGSCVVLCQQLMSE